MYIKYLGILKWLYSCGYKDIGTIYLILGSFLIATLLGVFLYYYFFGGVSSTTLRSAYRGPTPINCAGRVYQQDSDGYYKCPNYELCGKKFSRRRSVATHFGGCGPNRNGSLRSGNVVNHYMIWDFISKNWVKKN